MADIDAYPFSLDGDRAHVSAVINAAHHFQLKQILVLKAQEDARHAHAMFLSILNDDTPDDGDIPDDFEPGYDQPVQGMGGYAPATAGSRPGASRPGLSRTNRHATPKNIRRQPTPRSVKPPRQKRSSAPQKPDKYQSNKRTFQQSRQQGRQPAPSQGRPQARQPQTRQPPQPKPQQRPQPAPQANLKPSAQTPPSARMRFCDQAMCLVYLRRYRLSDFL